WRKDGGARDAFQHEALRRLQENPAQPVTAFTEYKGRPVLRYVSAWVLKPSCLNCHNRREDSPKNDWKVGDVRAALQIPRPLDGDVSGAREGRRGTFRLRGTVSGARRGTSVLVLVGNRRRRPVPAARPSESASSGRQAGGT